MSEFLIACKIAAIAAEYRCQGYSVLLSPSDEQLPQELWGMQLDLIAKSDAGTIAVSVRDRDGLRRSEDSHLKRITEAIQSLPGWVHELVVANPKRQAV